MICMAQQLLFWEVDLPSAAGLKQELVRWKRFWNEGRREDKLNACFMHMQMKTLNIRQLANFNWILHGYTYWNMSGRKVFFSFETDKNTLTFNDAEESLTGLTMMSVHHAECLSLPAKRKLDLGVSILLFCLMTQKIRCFKYKCA